MIMYADSHLPYVFVPREGQQVDGGEVGVNSDQVERQQDHQHLHNEPHQRRARLDSQQLRGEPEGTKTSNKS